jgi:hypothetical protein
MSHSLTRALPGFASANELEEMTANGHADGRFVAHFRRTQSLAPRRRSNDEGTRGTRMQDVTVKSAKKTANQRKPRKSADEQSRCIFDIGKSGSRLSPPRALSRRR